MPLVPPAPEGEVVQETIQVARPPLYELQERALFAPERFVGIEAGTKSGKTVGALAWIVEQWFGAPRNGNCWWVAPTYAQTKIAFRRFLLGLPASLYRYNLSHLVVHCLVNGASLWFKTGERPDALYGEDVVAVVVDEASRCREEVWHAVRSVLTHTRGPCRLIGNVKGKKNWFYRLCRRAEAGAPGWSFHRITALDAVAAGVLDAEEIEEARATLPDAVFQELYMAVPTEDGSNPFGLAHVEANILEDDLAKPAEPVCWGWDLARKRDYTVGVALDRNGHGVRFERFQRSWEHTVKTIMERTGRLPAMVDATGVGDPVVETLVKWGGDNFHPFVFTAVSKQQLLEALALAIQSHQVTYPNEGWEVLVQELVDFEFEHTRTGVRYAAPEGGHDDCVIALALAWHAHQDPSCAPVVFW